MKKLFTFLFCWFASASLNAGTPCVGKIIESKEGRYLVIQKLGQGVFGKVYEVQNPLEISFALKWYRPPKGYKGLFSLYADAKREFYLGQLFDHPSIIHSVEYFAQGSDEYVVLEYVKGKVLNCIPRFTFTPMEAKKIALNLVEALQYSYRLKRIFLDLYLDNLMLTENYELKIVDLASFISLDEIRSLLKQKKLLAKANPASEEKIAFDNLLKAHVELQSNTVYQGLAKNFDKIVHIVSQIFDKSTLDRENRLHIKSSIKKLAWYCYEDSEENKPISLDSYLHLLQELLNSLDF